MRSIQHILIVGSVWPEPNSSAAGSHMMQIIELFQSQQWKVTYASPAADSEHMIDFSAHDIEKVNIQLNNSSFDTFVSNLNPSIVLFDRFMVEEQFGWRVAEQCPNALRMIETVDLHCLRVARHNALKENRTFTYNDLMLDVAKREMASILRCDISLIISDFEMELLQSHFKIDKALLHYLPFLLDRIEESEVAQWPKFNERTHFVTIGNFLHEPNWNAVLYLKEEIWPLIRKELPQAELHVYGAYATQKVNELHKPKEGFFIMGRAADAMEVVTKARVCLAPLRFGAGIKGKLVEAMQCGTPSVTTSIGAEGMRGKMDWNGSITDNPKEFAAAAVQLYSNENIWQEAQNNGVNIINNFYAKEMHGEGFLQRIQEVQQNLEAHRRANFMGAMLMHHTISSTKYMSRWIEAKNKPK